MGNRKKKEHDFAVTAFHIGKEATGQAEPESKKPRKEYDYKTLEHKNSKARAEKLSPERRSEIAKKAAQARWKTKVR